MAAKNDITVFISSRDSTCAECGEALGRPAWITLDDDKKALCLSCSDLDHLVYLPAGDAALTRRSRKHSTLSAVVVEWSKRRKRYERQGVLVESAALEQAEQECLADSDIRERRRERDAVRRVEQDRQYIEAFAGRVRALFPGCPNGREEVIAEHACLKYSGRVGRSAAAKELDDQAVRLAVIAHIRHVETDYDSLLAGGTGRRQARQAVEAAIDRVLTRWQS
ncbi:MAG: DUF2293 domain-containing protein [Anaerolineae bacterium]|nr:DUF2293 domain-containing protein [Anaerolineae bacterium]